MVKRAIADRLILVDVVDRWFHLQEPTFIDVGQCYWIDRETSELCVERGGDRVTRHGRVTRHAGWMCR
ncbi:hypothetical protein [Actinoplanes derwentensis]|uniref:Uncharacterized protein n=1 Tax=Actinoplanes derwentensis TaxID=113562 RepID=A0A1H2DDT8_9ACTN|nr:hypothetical protein [Actinoplanes derwentensis]SDT80662.1 hypothetical protein SAMN04489716_9303 [Actinoplanes derwentensis]